MLDTEYINTLSEKSLYTLNKECLDYLAKELTDQEVILTVKKKGENEDTAKIKGEVEIKVTPNDNERDKYHLICHTGFTDTFSAYIPLTRDTIISTNNNTIVIQSKCYLYTILTV